jgi:hypothetical protein
LRAVKGGGSTVVRLVHSGFGAGANWDEMYDSLESGWAYFLFHLAFYLVRHRGRLRRAISSRRRTTKSVSEIWRRLLGADGMGIGEVEPGATCTIHLGEGSHEGRVEILREGRILACRLPGLSDGLMFVEMEPGSPEWHCGVWISLYDVPDDRAELVRDGLTALMESTFAS